MSKSSEKDEYMILGAKTTHSGAIRDMVHTINPRPNVQHVPVRGP